MKRAMKELAHGAWRLLPQDFRRNAMSGLAASLARRPDANPPAASDGIVVAGDVTGWNGLAESARIMHQVIATAGLSRGMVPLGLPSVVPAYEGELPAGAAVLAVVNAPFLPVALLRMRRDFLKNRRVIGMWAWELSVLPRQWRYGAGFAHEIWAPSPFAAAAIEGMAPGRVRFVPYPIGAVELAVEGDRALFGLPEDALVVLTVFNLSSSPNRKNPAGNIAAFRAAFGERRDCLFVMKISGSESYEEDLREIKEAVGDAKNIRLMIGTMPEAQLRGLIAAADIVLSLHRSEGFGLIPATGMLLGRPVVATGWSGNMGFMTAESSVLVDYKLIPAVDPRGVYRVADGMWAEPDLDSAVAGLRALAESAAMRARIGEAGREQARMALGSGPILRALAANGVTSAAA
jgi:glycosyltransferase involved in cell wall biosynthesis